MILVRLSSVDVGERQTSIHLLSHVYGCVVCTCMCSHVWICICVCGGVHMHISVNLRLT